MDHLSPSSRLNESVHWMNDAARWGRIDLAIQYVEPAFRDRFLQTHQQWGRKIKVADVDLVRIEVDPISDDVDKAVVLVSYSWYKLDTMTLHQTVIRQFWRDIEGDYRLGAEDVFEGDPFLIAMPDNRSNDRDTELKKHRTVEPVSGPG